MPFSPCRARALAVLAMMLGSWAPVPASASTKRTAFVRVINNTGKKLGYGALQVLHKYSDDYKNTYVYDGELAAGAATNDTNWITEAGSPHGKAIVEYNTGAFTTGRDWWVVNYVTQGDWLNHITSPENFRIVFDVFEGGAPRVLAALGGIVGAAVAVALLPVTAGASAVFIATTAASAAAGAAAKAMSQTVMNDGSTVGFKQCILREEDENNPAQIFLNSDGTVTWRFNSGSCDTGTRSIETTPTQPFVPPPNVPYTITANIPTQRIDVVHKNGGFDDFMPAATLGATPPPPQRITFNSYLTSFWYINVVTNDGKILATQLPSPLPTDQGLCPVPTPPTAADVINGAISNNAGDPDKGIADAADGLALQIVKRRDPDTLKFCGMTPCTVSVNDTRVDVIVNSNTIEISGHPASKGKCTLSLKQVWPAS